MDGAVNGSPAPGAVRAVLPAAPRISSSSSSFSTGDQWRQLRLSPERPPSRRDQDHFRVRPRLPGHPHPGTRGSGPVSAAEVVAGLRAHACRLAGDLAVWAERDPAEPLEFQPEALAARQDALQVIDEAIGQLRRLRRELAGGSHRARGGTPDIAQGTGILTRPGKAGQRVTGRAAIRAQPDRPDAAGPTTARGRCRHLGWLPTGRDGCRDGTRRARQDHPA
jgi:hypothetical protein